MARWSTVLSGIFLALSMVLCLGKLLLLATENINNGEINEAEQWLTEIGLEQYKPLFREKGMQFNQLPNKTPSKIKINIFISRF